MDISLFKELAILEERIKEDSKRRKYSQRYPP